MRLFVCDHCGNPVHFDNTVCLACGHRLGYRPEAFTMTALPPAAPGATVGGERIFCANADLDACNWLLEPGATAGLCPACRHNRTIPDLSAPGHLDAFRRITLAERQLFYSLMRWNLAAPTRLEDPVAGLAFDFLAPEIGPDGTPAPVMTGHEDGVVTIALAEADDAERESRRSELGEPYRTLLGHFRHEVGHYYWDRLVRDGGRLEEFRALFGDERRDYQEALSAHYRDGPRPDWASAHISSYAASHPWEDFAETWAHCLHMVDALETARGFGLELKPRLREAAALDFELDFSPYATTRVGDLVDAFVPLTVAVNAINRSMGQVDLYPFVLSDPVIDKLSFVLSLVHDDDPRDPCRSPRITAAATTGISTRSADGLPKIGTSVPAGSSMMPRLTPVSTTISTAAAASFSISSAAVDRPSCQSTTAIVGVKPRSCATASLASYATATRVAPSWTSRISRSWAMIGSSSTTRAVHAPETLPKSEAITYPAAVPSSRRMVDHGNHSQPAPSPERAPSAFKNDTSRRSRKRGRTDERRERADPLPSVSVAPVAVVLPRHPLRDRLHRGFQDGRAAR